MNYNLLILICLHVILLSSCIRPDDKGWNPSPTPTDTLSTGWRKITMPDANQTFNDIFFINNTTGYLAGSQGYYKSTDGGNSWQKVYTSGAINLGMGSESNIAFVKSGEMIFTKNGGSSFDSVSFNSSLSDMFFINANTAYATGDSFWKTTNGGTSWTKLYDFPSFVYSSMHFINEQNGWIAGGTGVFKTINGGVNWESKSVATGLSFGITGNVYFVDQNNGYATDGSSVVKTTNGGTSWSKVLTVGNGSYVDLHFITSDIGYVADGKYIWKTINGGASWTKDVVAHGGMIEIHFTDSNHGWACGEGGVLKFER